MVFLQYQVYKTYKSPNNNKKKTPVYVCLRVCVGGGGGDGEGEGVSVFLSIRPHP